MIKLLSFRCSWSIACRRYSNYIFILDLTPHFHRLRKRQLQDETGSISVLVFGASYMCLILETWRHHTRFQSVITLLQYSISRFCTACAISSPMLVSSSPFAIQPTGEYRDNSTHINLGTYSSLILRIVTIRPYLVYIHCLTYYSLTFIMVAWFFIHGSSRNIMMF